MDFCPFTRADCNERCGVFDLRTGHCAFQTIADAISLNGDAYHFEHGGYGKSPSAEIVNFRNDAEREIEKQRQEKEEMYTDRL